MLKHKQRTMISALAALTFLAVSCSSTDAAASNESANQSDQAVSQNAQLDEQAFSGGIDCDEFTSLSPNQQLDALQSAYNNAGIDPPRPLELNDIWPASLGCESTLEQYVTTAFDSSADPEGSAGVAARTELKLADGAEAAPNGEYNWERWDDCRTPLAYDASQQVVWQTCSNSIATLNLDTGSLDRRTEEHQWSQEVLFDGTVARWRTVPATATRDSQIERQVVVGSSGEILQSFNGPKLRARPIEGGFYFQRDGAVLAVFDITGKTQWELSDLGSETVDSVASWQGALIRWVKVWGGADSISRLDPATGEPVWELSGYKHVTRDDAQLGYVYVTEDVDERSERLLLELATGELFATPLEGVGCRRGSSHACDENDWVAMIESNGRTFVYNNGLIAELDEMGNELFSLDPPGSCKFVAAGQGVLADCNEIYHFGPTGKLD